jgi:hypothetical protein
MDELEVGCTTLLIDVVPLDREVCTLLEVATGVAEVDGSTLLPEDTDVLDTVIVLLDIDTNVVVTD